MSDEPNGDRVSVARATLRAELADLELRLVDRINVALEKTADRVTVDALDKRVDGLEISRAERAHIPGVLDKMSRDDDEHDRRLTALERFRYAVPSASFLSFALGCAALAYSLTHQEGIILDLSNNNATGHNFRVAYVKGGQRRVYLKRCEGTGYTDKTFPGLRTAALKAGFHVGPYDFLHPLQASPNEAATYLLNLLPLPLKAGRDLRPCLDCEQGTPSAAVGRWITETAKIVQKHTGPKPLLYGGGWWFEACQFTSAPGPLWLAAYGRNDGKEYPVGKLPSPWKTMAAHQYTSTANVVGINGHVDLSHVFVPASIEVPARLEV